MNFSQSTTPVTLANASRNEQSMKTKLTLIQRAGLLLLLSTLSPPLSTVFAQGSLTSPGAPAPTMKTLAQIEPRTPISSAPFTISVPGSYYLTTNLTFSVGMDDKHIATVDADGVALAAIQGLNQKLEEQRAENAELKARLTALEQFIAQSRNLQP